MGFSKFDLVRAQGTSVRPKSEVVDEATEMMDKTFPDFYAN